MNSCQCSEALQSIEEKLVVKPVFSEERKNLLHELEEVSSAIQKLEMQAAHY